jgi:asparagine synthase (glutamine-hydrolysing)
MFAFALYDCTKKCIFLARDPIGKKPLYYYYDGINFIFASEIKAILECLNSLSIKKEIDIQGLCSYLRNQYNPGDSTIFKNIKKVPPGHVLILDEKIDAISFYKYWDIYEKTGKGTEQFYLAKLRNLIEESVKLRMVADVPIGSFLSGGIDSSSLTAIAKKHIDYDFHTFSLGFGQIFSELPYAKIVSEHLDTVHHEIVLESSDVIRHIETIAWHYDEPMSDPAIIANFFLAKEAKKYVKVVIAGEGGDELFGGYSTYNLGLKLYRYFSLPKLFRDGLGIILANTPGYGNIIHNTRRMYLNYSTYESLEMAHQYSWKIFSLKNKEISWLGYPVCNKQKDRYIMSENIRQPLNRMLALDCKNHLPERYLMKADKATMANSIEERLPLLDKNIIDFAFEIPPYLKIKSNKNKYILIKSVKDLLPKAILERKKTGFNVPYVDWVKNDLNEYIISTIENGNLTKKLFERDKLSYLLKNFKQSNFSRPTAIVWSIFSLQLWDNIYKISYTPPP